ncbi:platelet factor 4-like isoform X1 [Prionailurus viverrinus]|uniref:platelet factor 4-like isoform X1 n=1 Tax=Prionailurus viverrinus TaxID=61388 RepID=UPI001FF40511|nr:platelet factor 4-like isoform X1 [Prionailurus viverrinus]
MRLRVGARAPRPLPISGLLLLGLLLLPAVVALPRGVRTLCHELPGALFIILSVTLLSEGGDPEGDEHLRCMCVKTTSEVRPKHIRSLEVMGATVHCPVPQMIASLKNGRKICLDPDAPLYKKILRKLLES